MSHGFLACETRRQSGPLSGCRIQDVRNRQLNGLMLSGGIVFILGMAINVATLRDARKNVLDLADLSENLRRLAAHRGELASREEHQISIREQSPRDRTDITTRALPTVVATLSQPASIDSPESPAVQQPVSPPQSPAPMPYEPISDKRIAHGKWGPPLILITSKSAKQSGNLPAIPHRDAVQRDLLTLGFDVRGDLAVDRTDKRTRQALNEFNALYLPASERQKTPGGEQLAARIKKYAVQARKDHERYSIDSGILAAIRLGSLRTGVEFSFLMELAATESSFDPNSVAPITDAAGLYQFKEDTWLEAVKNYGMKYGMESYSSQVESYVDESGNRRLRIHNTALNEYVLSLRHNPRISALLAAEYVKLNSKRLAASLDRALGHTEMYLTHFFGATGAISFLRTLDESPNRIAGEVFPIAAEHNRALFHPKRSKPRTVAEIYRMFERKFSRSRYKDANPS